MEYHVIHLDFSNRTYNAPKLLKHSLLKFLKDTATKFDVELENNGLLSDNLITDTFEELIEKIYYSSKKRLLF
jgi:hypothetical protein